MNPPVSLPNGGPRQAEPKLHPVRGLGRAVFVYFIAVFASILLAAVFDNFFVLPPVEVDEALSLVNTAPAALTMVRNIGAYALPTTVNVSFLTVYVWPVLSFLGNTKDEEPSASVLTRVIRAPQVVATVALVGWTSSFFFITGIDLATLEFPVASERLVYVATTFAAMFASGYLPLWLSIFPRIS
jgi:hypothetical protein